MTFTLSLVTLNGTSHYDDVVRVTLETPQGQTTILPHHERLLSLLSPGMLELEKRDSSTTTLVVSGGFIEVNEDGSVELLLDALENPEAVDIESAERAKERAREMLERKDELSDIDYARFESMLEHEIARLRIATKGGRM